MNRLNATVALLSCLLLRPAAHAGALEKYQAALAVILEDYETATGMSLNTPTAPEPLVKKLVRLQSNIARKTGTQVPFYVDTDVAGRIVQGGPNANLGIPLKQISGHDALTLMCQALSLRFDVTAAGILITTTAEQPESSAANAPRSQGSARSATPSSPLGTNSCPRIRRRN